MRLNGALHKWPFSIFFKYQFWWPQNLFFVFAFTLNWKIEYFVGHQGIICVTQRLWEHFCWHKNIKFVHQLTYDIQNYHMSLNVKISFIFILDMSITKYFAPNSRIANILTENLKSLILSLRSYEKTNDVDLTHCFHHSNILQLCM